MIRPMIVHTDYLWFNTKQRREIVRITDEVAAIVKHERRAARAWCSCRPCTSRPACTSTTGRAVSSTTSRSGSRSWRPSGLDYRHHQTGEDNADAHLKRTVIGHQVMVPITKGALDLGPWEQVFYAEFDGRRRKRVVVKVMGQ